MKVLHDDLQDDGTEEQKSDDTGVSMESSLQQFILQRQVKFDWSIVVATKQEATNVPKPRKGSFNMLAQVPTHPYFSRPK